MDDVRAPHAPAVAADVPSAPEAHPHKASVAALSFGALGVVFGDIGTSPLYTLRDCLREAGGSRVLALRHDMPRYRVFSTFLICN